MLAAFYRRASALSRQALLVAIRRRMGQNHRVGVARMRAFRAAFGDLPMSIRCAAALLALALLAGCTRASRDEPVAPVVTGAIGTPFLIALKAPFCAATLVVAGPITALTELAAPSPVAPGDYDGAFTAALRGEVADGVRQNCGPPYLAGP